MMQISDKYIHANYNLYTYTTNQHLLVLKPSESTTVTTPTPTLLKEHKNQPTSKAKPTLRGAVEIPNHFDLRCLKSSTSVARRLPDPNSSSSERKGGDGIVVGWGGYYEWWGEMVLPFGELVSPLGFVGWRGPCYFLGGIGGKQTSRKFMVMFKWFAIYRCNWIH